LEATVTVRPALDVIQALLLAAEHPGIAAVEPYGPGVGGIEGIRVRLVWEPSNSMLAYLAGSDLGPDGRPIDRKPAAKAFLPTVPWAPVPDPKADGGTRDKWLPVDYMLHLVYGLLEVARPDSFRLWEPVGLDRVGLGHGPSGLAITTAAGARLVLRVYIGSGTNQDPDDDPWPGYRTPDRLTAAA
jgi:hypothetical protein